MGYTAHITVPQHLVKKAEDAGYTVLRFAHGIHYCRFYEREFAEEFERKQEEWEEEYEQEELLRQGGGLGK